MTPCICSSIGRSPYRSFPSYSFLCRANIAALVHRRMGSSLHQPPSSGPSFKVVKPVNHEVGARLGCLSFPGRQALETPDYIAVSSRGAVPHLSQDTMRDSTSIKGLYAGLEDCKLNFVVPNFEMVLTNILASRS